MKKIKTKKTMRLLILSLLVSTFLITCNNVVLTNADNSKITSSDFNCPVGKNLNDEVPNNEPSFLFMGDSIMEYVGNAIESKLKTSYNIKASKIDFKISSGLNRRDFYDWYRRTPKLMECYNPDIVVIMFGGNDYQNIKDDDGKSISIFSPEWKEVYRKRVEKYAQLVTLSTVKKVYWIGQPISSKSQYNKSFPILNAIYEDVSKEYPQIKFINTWESFTINGKYSLIMSDRSGKKGKVRTKDALHITAHGSNILA
ncbi:MAG TPA: DUF459 domain-containing protein, partial [Allocoleopsis sp.]